MSYPELTPATTWLSRWPGKDNAVAISRGRNLKKIWRREGESMEKDCGALVASLSFWVKKPDRRVYE